MEITSIIKEDFLMFEDTITVSEMIGKLIKYEKRSGLVFRNHKYLGLIEKKFLLKTKLDTKEVKLKNIVQNTPLIDEHASVIETAYLMFQSDFDFLPVARNKGIIGVISALDLVSLAATMDELKKVNVKDAKLLKSIMVEKNDPLAKAVRMMFLKRTEPLPVMEMGKLYGLISHRDILRKYLNWTPQKDVKARFNKVASTRSAEVDMPNLANSPVSSFSTNDNLVTIALEDKLVRAIQLMNNNNVMALPVLKNGDFLGMLTIKNVLRVISSLNIPEKYNIQFVGLRELNWDPYEVEELKKIAANESFKLQRQVKNDVDLIIHLKEYDKEGKRCKYAVNLRVEFPGKIVTVSQDDWDWRTAVRKTFENAENKVKKSFHRDVSGRNNY